MIRTTKEEELIMAVIAPRLEAGAERESVKDATFLRFVQFFGAHPYTWFDRPAVFDANRPYGDSFTLGESLRVLVDRRIIKERVINGRSLYSLNRDEPSPGQSRFFG